MPADRLLSTLIRALHSVGDHQNDSRILGTALSLLTSLNNPRNVTILTSQLLIAPALWASPDGLRTSLHFMGIFNSAAIRFIERERPVNDNSEIADSRPNIESYLPIQEWVHAVVKGADEHSPPSLHLLVLSGLLIGFSSQDAAFLSSSLGRTLQTALVKAANLALVQTPISDDLSQARIVLAINHAFTFLSDPERSQIDYDRLLPVLMHSTLHSADGLCSGYFVGAADVDLQQASGKQFNWSKSSKSFQRIDGILTGPLIANLGPLSRLIAHTVGNARNSLLVLSAVEDLADFSRRLLVQWRQNKLSEIDATEEVEFLHEEARRDTVPALWKLLRSTMYAVVIILRSAVGRVLGDGVLALHDNAPHIADESLHALRGLSFIHTRIGSAAFSQYTFTYLAAIDILAAYPAEAEHFLQSIRPTEPGRIPGHPLERCLDLFFLNTAEQFTLTLSSHLSEELIIAAAAPYLTTGGNPRLLPIFEAAHSNMLAVFSAPHNVEITAKHLPFYVDALFRVFPHNLSPRQFRLAFTNLIRVTSPPSLISATQPLLAATLLEVVHERALDAPTAPLPQNSIASPMPGAEAVVGPQLSEQGVLVSTLIDALPSLAHDLLEEWLPITTGLVNRIPDTSMREHCKKHFWDVIVGGEMDPERSQICVMWWTSRGGREMLLFGEELTRGAGAEKYVMSGGLDGGGATAAKL